MSPEKQKLLFDEFGDMITDEPRQSLRRFGFECGDGWYVPLRKLFKMIKSYIENGKLAGQWSKQRNPGLDDSCMCEYPPFKVVQVKEKFADLRFYTNWTDEYIDGLIAATTAWCSTICEGCGKSGDDVNVGGDGWIKRLCPKCREDFERERYERASKFKGSAAAP